MLVPFATSLSFLVFSLAHSAGALNNVTSLLGTWSSKSNTVFTGSDFYDPVTEKMREPRLTGTSFSFTDNGYFEEAFYLVIPNQPDWIAYKATSPACTKAIMQWQHGKYHLADNGSLILHPITVDGRQLLSDPCGFSNSIYTRFNATEIYKRWEISVDEYHGKHRLNLYRFDGSPMNPLYLAYRPPQMLPTQTLNPTSVVPKVTGGSKPRLKRSLPSNLKNAEQIDVERWWWIGVVLTSIGLLGYFYV